MLAPRPPGAALAEHGAHARADARRRAAAAAALRRRRAGPQPRDHPEPRRPGALAEPLARDPPVLDLLPERLRRPHRQQGDAGRRGDRDDGQPDDRRGLVRRWSSSSSRSWCSPAWTRCCSCRSRSGSSPTRCSSAGRCRGSTRMSEEVSDARSVMTGRMVDSYTNIQTLKTFADDGDEDAYVAESVDPRTSAPSARLMAIFTWSWSLLFLLNALLVGSVTWIALAAWNAGHDVDGDGGDGDPLRAADHEHLGLDPRDRLERVPPDRHGPRLDGDDRQAADPRRRARTRRPLAVAARRDRLRPRRLRLLARRRRLGGARLQPDRAPGREDRPRRPLRRRQVDAGQPDAAACSTSPRARSASTARTSARVTQQSLRQAIGVVGQDTSLLHRSVRDNIKYGRPRRHRRRDGRGGEARQACTT